MPTPTRGEPIAAAIVRGLPATADAQVHIDTLRYGFLERPCRRVQGET